MKVAFLGLGVMGYPMAGHLAKAGFDVTVYNRTNSKADQWLGEHQGCSATTPALAVNGAEMVFACVGKDDDVYEVTLGEQGAFSKMLPGSIFIDHTTTSARIAQTLYAEAQVRGLHFLDAPISGGQAGAEQGCLSVMVGGDVESFEISKPVIDHYAKITKRMGGAGCGQLTKMVNQICLTGIIQSLSEGLFFAEKAGLDPKSVIDVISKGAAQSWQMENRGHTMVDREFEFGFAVDLMRKDLNIVAQQAETMGVELPVMKMVDDFYQNIQALGGHRWDTSSLIKNLDCVAENH